MPAILNASGEGLKRVTGILPANEQYVTTTWWFYISQFPASGTKHTLYMVSNSADRANQSIIIAQDDTGFIRLYVAGVTYGGMMVRPGWHSIGIRRNVPSNHIGFDIDNDSSAVANATVTFSGWTFDEEYLGLDPRDTVNPLMQVSYFRQWSAFLSYVAEWRVNTPVQTTSLETNTPLVDDLLDDTDNHNDWTIVGAVTFVPDPTSNVGSMGGWWFHGSIPITSPECILRAQLVDVLGGTTARDIVFFRINFTGGSSVGDIITESHWEVRLYYASGPGLAGTDFTEAGVVADPFPAPDVGLNITAIPARNSWCVRTRWAMAWKCSTYDSVTSTYAADGYVKLYLNGDTTPLIQAVDITIPRKVDGFGIQYTFSPMIDGDRMWARTVVDIPATDVEGAFTSGTPSDLVYFEDFNDGSVDEWTAMELWPTGGGSTPLPNIYDNCGGDNGYGLSTWAMKPDTTTATGTYLPYAGMWKFHRFPPITIAETPTTPPDKSGIYYVNPQKVTKHDSYYGDVESKIPDPTVRTGLLGD